MEKVPTICTWINHLLEHHGKTTGQISLELCNSGSQTLLHTGITWRAFKALKSQIVQKNSEMRMGGGVRNEEQTQALVIFKTPQVIPITAEVKTYCSLSGPQTLVRIRIIWEVSKNTEAQSLVCFKEPGSLQVILRPAVLEDCDSKVPFNSDVLIFTTHSFIYLFKYLYQSQSYRDAEKRPNS